MVKIFLTSFPVVPTKTIDDFLYVARSWLLNSPHRSVTAQQLEGLGNDGYFHTEQQGELTEEIKTIAYESPQGKSIGIRVTQISEQDQRHTDIVSHTTKKAHAISVSHDYQARKSGGSEYTAAKPRIVNDLLDNLGNEYDGNILRVQRTPYWLNDSDLEFVAEVINNQSNNSLPVIYLSKDNRGFTAVHPNRLATMLGGMSHVLVEPSRQFSFDLRKQVNEKNAYNGAVGIYWTNGMRDLVFPHSSRNIEDELYDTVREYALFTLLSKELTFDGVSSLQTAARLEAVKTDRKSTIEDAMNLAIDEIERRETEIQQLKSQIHNLTNRLSEKSQQKQTGDIILPQMTELYPGELRDYLIEALEISIRATAPDSRRMDVINSLLKQNQSTETHTRVVQELSDIFKNYKKISPAIENQLRALGFEVDTSGKHVKIYVLGDNSRFCTIPKTPSDHRSMKNALSEIKNTLL